MTYIDLSIIYVAKWEGKAKTKPCHFTSQSFYYRYDILTPKCRKDRTSAKDNFVTWNTLSWMEISRGCPYHSWVVVNVTGGRPGPTWKLQPQRIGWVRRAPPPPRPPHTCARPHSAPWAPSEPWAARPSFPLTGHKYQPHTLESVCTPWLMRLSSYYCPHYFSLQSCHWAHHEPKDIIWPDPFSRAQLPEGTPSSELGSGLCGACVLSWEEIPYCLAVSVTIFRKENGKRKKTLPYMKTSLLSDHKYFPCVIHLTQRWGILNFLKSS